MIFSQLVSIEFGMLLCLFFIISKSLYYSIEFGTFAFLCCKEGTYNKLDFFWKKKNLWVALQYLVLCIWYIFGFLALLSISCPYHYLIFFFFLFFFSPVWWVFNIFSNWFHYFPYHYHAVWTDGGMCHPHSLFNCFIWFELMEVYFCLLFYFLFFGGYQSGLKFLTNEFQQTKNYASLAFYFY